MTAAATHATHPAHTGVYTGTLLDNAQARIRVIDAEGHSAPVICMDVLIESIAGNHMHIEQPFPIGQLDAARAAAARLKKGTPITFQVALADVSLIGKNVLHIHTHHTPTPETPKPCQA